MSEELRPQGYTKRREELEGMPVGIVTFQLGDRFVCTVDNVSPGAVIARAVASSRDAAEQEAVHRAARQLAATARRRAALRELRDQVDRLDRLFEG